MTPAELGIASPETQVAQAEQNAGLQVTPVEVAPMSTRADVAARQELTTQISQAMPNLTTEQQSVAADLLSLRADALNMGLSEYMQTFHQEGVFSQAPAQEGIAQGKKGAVTFQTVGDQAKALIHITETSDFSTWVHENAHIFRRQLNAEQLAPAEQVYNVKNGVWTRASEEWFARDFENYLQDGKAPTPQLQTIFQKIAQWMREIYHNFTGKINIDPRIRTVFDSLLAKPESPLSVQPEAQVRASDVRALPGQAQAEQSQRMVLSRDMSKEALVQDRLTNRLTGVPNETAYEEYNHEFGTDPIQVSLDADSLKWINDTFGHDKGNKLLTTIAHGIADVVEGTDLHRVSLPR